MAHRIYLYNFDQKTSELFNTYLGEWNYEIPLLLYPLIAQDIRLDGNELYANKEQGIVQLRYFYNLLADTYQLHYKKEYYEAVNEMFAFLEALPYDSFVINASDVFNMNDEAHTEQAKLWLDDIKQKAKRYKKAVHQQDLSLLDSLFTPYGYDSFLAILQTDWVKYGLGYFELSAYKYVASSVFEEEGKYGLKSMKGDILAPAIYDEIFDTDSYYDISVVCKDGKFGYLSSKGEAFVLPIYEEALDVFYSEDEPLAEVTLNGKKGVLKVYSNQFVVPVKYDEIEVLHYGFFRVKKDGKYGICTYTQQFIIPIESDTPYLYDYFPDLFFVSQLGTAKRKYYTQTGHYLGEYLENSIIKAADCYWIKPNKLHKKGLLLDEKGAIVADEVDQLLLIEHFDTVGLRKAKCWQLYHTAEKRFLLQEDNLISIKAVPSAYRKQNIFIIKSEKGLGLYDAEQEQWLIAPEVAIQQMQYIENGFLSVQKEIGYQLFDFEEGLSTEFYDYISNPLNYRTEEGLLFLYKDDAMFIMQEDKSIRALEMTAYGSIFLDRYSFRGKDLTYFIQFYERWKKQAGREAEAYMDLETIRKIAFDAKEKENYAEALRLFEVAAQRNDVDSWVEIGLLLTDPNIEELFNPQRGIQYYEKAMKQNHAVAWNNIGALYQNGIGHAFHIKKAIKAYEKAAQLGDGMAMVNLGDLYFFGQHIKQNYAKALHFYLQAEAKRYYHYDKIAEIYYQDRDYENLLNYLKKDYESTYSGIYYGILYEHGMGVEVDLKKALKYYEQANAYSAYEYATQRLLYYYGEDSTFKNEKKYQKWKSFATENGFEMD